MKMSLALALLVSVPALAQRMNECPRPGQILGTQYMGEDSDVDSNSHRRSGNNAIPSEANFSGNLRARIYKNYRDQICRAESYIHQEKICDRISPDLALGRGNHILKSLYDLQNSTLKRADILARNTSFQQGTDPALRLESARQVVSVLASAAVMGGIPNSWEEFTSVLQKAVTEGTLQQYLVDEIVMIHSAINKRNLGFLPLEGAIVNEGRGNGRLNEIFDLGITPEHRAMRIQKLITGVNQRTARELSRTVVIFAASNGIPRNWNQFVVLMRDARNQNALSDRELRQITVEFEDVNRDAMGFEINAQVCRIENQTRYQNVVRVDNRRVLDREVQKSYSLTIAGAPLVNGEEESFSVRYDGVRSPELSIASSYNTFSTSETEENGVRKFILNGARKKVTPENNLYVKLNVSGKISTIQLQNKNFNASVGGKIIVQAKYYNARFFGSDKLLATETYELNDGNLKVITAALRNKEVDYVKVSMKIEGSQYFNNNFSEEIKAKD